jgi:hypothetical protein
MKTITNSLKIELERWDDPGDYPSGAGSGPLASQDFVAAVNGEIEVELSSEELSDICSGLEVTDPVEQGRQFRESVEDYLIDNSGEVDANIEVTVTKWCIDKISSDGSRLTLSVEEFASK